jgi:hypothetical protein
MRQQMLYPVSAPIHGETSDLFGFINEAGDIVIPFSYAGCSHFFEGKAVVIDGTRKSGFIDAQGKLSISPRFEGTGRYYGGLCAIDGGYIDHSGNWLIEPQFLVSSEFSEGCAFASRDGENFGFIDYRGQFIGEARFRPCRSFSEGLAAVCIDDHWGYIDRDQVLQIPSVFEGSYATPFRGGLAGIQMDGQWGFINRVGSFTIGPMFEEVKGFSEGRACVKKQGKWGLIDTEGTQVVECRFDELRSLNAGMAAAKLEGRAGFISSDGLWLIEPRFEKCYGFWGELGIVRQKKTYSYIRRNGQIVWTSEPGAQVPYPPAPIFI